jgi:hypothetical protein
MQYCLFKYNLVFNSAVFEKLLGFPERFEDFTAMTMKNAVSCDIKTLFLTHRRPAV